jgi:hypothetical protein
MVVIEVDFDNWRRHPEKETWAKPPTGDTQHAWCMRERGVVQFHDSSSPASTIISTTPLQSLQYRHTLLTPAGPLPTTTSSRASLTRCQCQCSPKMRQGSGPRSALQSTDSAVSRKLSNAATIPILFSLGVPLELRFHATIRHRCWLEPFSSSFPLCPVKPFGPRWSLLQL